MTQPGNPASISILKTPPRRRPHPVCAADGPFIHSALETPRASMKPLLLLSPRPANGQSPTRLGHPLEPNGRHTIRPRPRL